MAIVRIEHGSVPDHWLDIDPQGRRFLFDDRKLPPAAQTARRNAYRLEISRAARNRFNREGVGGLPAGNLLDVVPDADGWRNV